MRRQKDIHDFWRNTLVIRFLENPRQGVINVSEKITTICKDFVQPGDRIVAAVSGGADSICLAHALLKVLPWDARLFIVHVNHQLRGAAADEDARFVCQWAAEAGVPRAIVRINIKHHGGESAQSIARTLRYNALLNMCRHFRANKLATGHHADDQIETFLLNLLRGSGGKGLQGIPRQRRLDSETEIIRPLLEVNREEIEEYCRSNQLEWRTDSSNASMHYVRNRIRHQLLPQLREYNSGIDRVILNTISSIRLEQELLTKVVAQALAEVAVPSPLPFAPNALKLDIFRELDPALQARVALKLMPDCSESVHLRSVLKLMDSQTGSVVDLPGGHMAYRLHDSIAIGKSPPSLDLTEVMLPIPGEVMVLGKTFRCSTDSFPGSTCYWIPKHIDCISVGFRKPGDYFFPPGGGKKLKDYMIDRKIPRWMRDYYPVLRAGKEIICISGLVRDQRSSKPDWDKKPVFIKIETTGGDNMKDNIGEILLDQQTILAKVNELGGVLDEDYRGKNPLVICVLKGALMFMADLTRAMSISMELDFMAVSSYGISTKSSGVVRILKDLETGIEGRHVLIIEDIIDTGLTLKYLVDILKSRKPASIKVCTLLDKPSRRQVQLTPDYCGFEIEDKFVVGYGLDFAENYRNLPFIGVLKPEAYQ